MQKLTFVSVLLSLIMMPPIVTTIVQAANIETSGSCTLADAITAANNDRAEGGCLAGRGTDTITLSQDITLTAALPQIVSEITIEGNGFTISGNNRYRIFYNDGGALTIHDLTIANGYVEGDLIRNADRDLENATANPIGGAIVNWQGTLTISDSNFSDNLAEYDGGAIYNREGILSIVNSVFSANLADSSGGAIYNWQGTLSIVNSVFSANLADSSGGAIEDVGELSIVNSAFSHNWTDEEGGAIINHGELSISGSTFSTNSADDSGGAIENWGSGSISNSTFSHNSADYSPGGAIYNRGHGELSINDSTFSNNSANIKGGAISNFGELTLRNSTFSGNLASSDFYVSRGGAIYNGRELRIRSNTFSGNLADKGGAIYNEDDGKLRMTNSIIAGNGGACYSDGRIRHNINNFIQDGSCDPAFSGDPMLGELVEPEDGSPAYYPLLAGSPAIDAADDEYCPDTDMLGTVRPQGAACDIGAYERPQ